MFAPSSSSSSFAKAVKEEPKPSCKLLITPLALQSIQLRSVKRREKDNNTESDPSKPQEPGLDLFQDLEAQTLEPPTVSNSLPDERSWRSSASSVLTDLSVCGNPTADTPSLAYPTEDQCDHLLNGGEQVECHLSFSSPPQSSQSSPVKQTPPAVSKKPQISLIPPFSGQSLNGHLDRDTTSLPQTEERTDVTQLQTAREEESSKTEQQQGSEGCSASAASPFEPAAAIQDAHLGDGPCVNGETLEEEAEEDESSSLAGSLSSKEDDNGKSH